ncbi:DNA-binding GntR family transcriptional regulator [Neorhizobium huautlense]|uniref:DNA-binding GntR family transcriptional regulator n=1 Tax=Neorhizobium huautlense TaxID=67774 RepID=A0ABT9PR94_9HYPH|nr:UTRA domain-containing protein [Neorhizobium huautlense]MDP9836978.1 DNA-binding GntR family transcriptional regulator [Neorhizobium huautlense]
MADGSTNDTITQPSSKLEQAIRVDLAEGRLAVDRRLPPERELAERYVTTRITLREALSHLEMDGLIYRENRRGWFVSDRRLVYNPLWRTDFQRMTREQNRQASTELIEAVSAIAPEAICALLEQPVGTEFWRIRRRRRVDGRLVVFVEHHLNKTVFSDILEQDLTGSLTNLYREKYALEYGDVSFEINPISLTGMPATELRCSDGTFGLQIVRVNRDQSGLILDCDVEYWRHDAVSIRIDTRDGPG